MTGESRGREQTRGWRLGARTRIASRSLEAGLHRNWEVVLGWFNRLKLNEDTILLIFGVFIGVVGAVGVIILFNLIDFSFELLYGVIGSGLPKQFFLYRPVLTAAGFALAALVVRRFEERPPGESSLRSVQLVPTLQPAVARRNGRVDARTAATRIAASAVTLGAGGAAGSEGPVAVVGSTVGSWIGRAFRFDSSRVKVLVGAGAAAGISAAFNTPLAGAFFALEEIMGSFTIGSFAPVVIASVVAAMITRSVFGDHPAIAIPMDYGYTTRREVFLFFPILGLLAGLVTVAFVRFFFGLEKFRGRLRISDHFIPWIGGGLVGLLVYLSHGMLVGYGHLAVRLDVFTHLSGVTLTLLAIGGIVATSLTLNSGGSGGVFAPSLYVGAATGAAFGIFLRNIFPNLGLHPESYALVGMGAVFAAATDAPLAAVLMVFEMTNDYAIVLPLMVAVVISYNVAKRIEPDSLYSGWLRRRGESLESGTSRELMLRLRVRDASETDPQVIGEAATVAELLEHLGRAEQTEYPVVNDDLQLVGMISLTDMGRLARDYRDLAQLILAADVATPTESVQPDDTLLEAVQKMGIRGASALPVVEPETEKVVGLVSRARILTLYEKALAGEAAEEAAAGAHGGH